MPAVLFFVGLGNHQFDGGKSQNTTSGAGLGCGWLLVADRGDADWKAPVRLWQELDRNVPRRDAGAVRCR